MKKLICILGILVYFTAVPVLSESAPVKKNTGSKKPPVAATKAVSQKPGQNTQKGIIDTSYQELSNPLDLLKSGDKWLDKKVSFEGTFVTFSPYALDYKGAMRASKDYIAFLVQRPDVPDHIIPLSELKLIYPRKKADQVMDFENGDTILVKGKVFSLALGDPWVDVEDVVLLKKSPENEAKSKKKASGKNKDLE